MFLSNYMIIKLNKGLLASFEVKTKTKQNINKKHNRNFTHNHMTKKNMPDNLKMQFS